MYESTPTCERGVSYRGLCQCGWCSTSPCTSPRQQGAVAVSQGHCCHLLEQRAGPLPPRWNLPSSEVTGGGGEVWCPQAVRRPRRLGGEAGVQSCRNESRRVTGPETKQSHPTAVLTMTIGGLLPFLREGAGHPGGIRDLQNR